MAYISDEVRRYINLFSSKPCYVFLHQPSRLNEVVNFYQTVFGATASAAGSSGSTNLQFLDSTTIVIRHEARSNVDPSANRTAIYETDDVDDAIIKATKAGAVMVVQDDRVILTDPFDFNFAWSYRPRDPSVRAPAHPPHIPALCSERLSWMNFHNDPHLTPHQLVHNRTCDYFLIGLDQRLSKLREYQSEFDNGNNDYKRVAFYTLPFFSSSSLSQLVSEMHDMISIARWVEIARCTTSQLTRWIVDSVVSNMIEKYDGLFNNLPVYRADPKHWWDVCAKLRDAATAVAILLTKVSEARSKLQDLHRVTESEEESLISSKVKEEISFWKMKGQ